MALKFNAIASNVCPCTYRGSIHLPVVNRGLFSLLPIVSDAVTNTDLWKIHFQFFWVYIKSEITRSHGNSMFNF